MSTVDVTHIKIGWMLGQLYKTEAEIDRWLASDQQFLNRRTPIEAIRDGDEDHVLAILRGLHEGVYS